MRQTFRTDWLVHPVTAVSYWVPRGASKRTSSRSATSFNPIEQMKSLQISIHSHSFVIAKYGIDVTAGMAFRANCGERPRQPGSSTALAANKHKQRGKLMSGWHGTSVDSDD